MKQYSEHDLQRALWDIADGLSIRGVGRKWGIPEATVRQRLHGTQSRNTAFGRLQRLSQNQEGLLAEWISKQAALGSAFCHQQVKGLAERMLGDGQRPLGRKWMQRFLRRNPSIRTQRCRAIDARRINGATADIIQEWFHRLDLPAILPIKPANGWNMDETGILEGKGSNGLVLGSSETKYIQKKQPGSRAWVSLIECVSARGRALPPLVMYKGKSVQQQWFPLDLQPYASWKFTATENGWTTDQNALEWLEKVFIPQTVPEDPSDTRLLVLDAHHSHTTTDFLWRCFQNHIHLLFLPPHTSHVLQPLDQSVFRPLKVAYRKYLGYLDIQSNSTVTGKRNFIDCYRRARLDALTIQVIKSSWKHTGLWPVDVAQPLSSPFTAGQSGSQQWDEAVSIVPWSTPRKSADLQRQLHLFNQLTQDTREIYTQRHLFRKVQKGWDQQAYRLTVLERQAQAFQAQTDSQQQGRRKRVQTDPNTTFANIEDIRRAQIAAGEAESSTSESSGSELSSEAESCIWVGGRDEE
ncbi:transposase [Colletotrichum tofieldiae]|uniref:Transposase n=1 Tax=Colletotrichum tofieldiae TaxID=708197 RepID=A0A166N5W7_9PEZI|nr:transposase [Colletotrichum tofieldiae]